MTAVVVRDLRFRFGRREVLRGLDLEAPRGAIYGLLGRNGAGKTTALKLLMGILKPRQGRISLLGRDVDRVTPKMRQRIGYVSQEQHFYKWMRVRALADFAGALYPTWDRAFLDELFDRFALDPKQRAGELSTGSKMKLGMALALAHRPPILILDEPTAGVDPVTRREILDLLKQRTSEPDGPTAILSTHDIFEIENASDWVGILHDGKLQHEGATADLPDRFRRVTGPLPEGVDALLEDEAGAVVRGGPERFGDAESRPASLADVFYALTKDR